MSGHICERCSRLDLTPDKFSIKFDAEKSATTQQSVESLRLLNERFPLGTVRDIREPKSNCPLCLLSEAVRHQALVSQESTTCHLIWEMDGRSSALAESEKYTRRLRLCYADSNSGAIPFGPHLILTVPPKYDKSDIGYKEHLNQDTRFLGRSIGTKANKKSLIREFLRLCEEDHKSPCRQRFGFEESFSETLTRPYFGVIDIQNETLVPLPFENNGASVTFAPYAAASYVWANNLSYRTTTQNIQDRRKPGGLAAVIVHLPKALQQSLRLVHGLGIRYMWIDSLCIIQDSSQCWNLNARAMHLIYGNATLTICGADGQDAETGLLALDENHQPEQNIVDYAPGARLMLHHPPEININASTWNRRAWTFQERLLSKRCAIFAGGQVYFQCRSTGMSEDMFADRQGRGWSLDQVGAPLQTLSQLEHRAAWFYANSVSLYTRRCLYEPFDILAAFSGMCKLMEGTMGAPFYFGLPQRHFSL